MHPEAMYAIEQFVPRELRFKDGTKVLEFGSLNINGSPRELFTSNVSYIGVDIQEGPGVDIVGDAATVNIDELDPFDIVICAEVFEHTPAWKDIIFNGWKHLKKGGVLVVTAASDPRHPHSAIHGGNLEPHEHSEELADYAGVLSSKRGVEYYHNIGQDELLMVLTKNFHGVEVKHHPRGDVYGKGIK